MRSVKGRLLIPFISFGFSLGLLILTLGVLQGAVLQIVAGLAVLGGLSALTLAGHLWHHRPQVCLCWKENCTPDPARRSGLHPGWLLGRPTFRRLAVPSAAPSPSLRSGSGLRLRAGGGRRSHLRSPYGRAYRLVAALVITAMLIGMIPLPAPAYASSNPSPGAAPPQRPAQQAQAQAAPSRTTPSGKGQAVIEGPPGVTVNLYNGNLNYRRVDLVTSPGGYPFPVLQSELYYNSFGTSRQCFSYQEASGVWRSRCLGDGLGEGWRFGYDIFYTESGVYYGVWQGFGGGPPPVKEAYGAITINWPDGRTVEFTRLYKTVCEQTEPLKWRCETLPISSFEPPLGVYDRLEEVSPYVFRLTTLEGTTYYFDSPRHHSVTRLEAENGLALTFTYDADGRLTKVQDAYRRALHLTYEKFGSGIDQVTRVTRLTSDFLNRSLTLTYNAWGHLAAITDPVGQVTSYQYHKVGGGGWYFRESGPLSKRSPFPTGVRSPLTIR